MRYNLFLPLFDKLGNSLCGTSNQVHAGSEWAVPLISVHSFPAVLVSAVQMKAFGSHNPSHYSVIVHTVFYCFASSMPFHCAVVNGKRFSRDAVH